MPLPKTAFWRSAWIILAFLLCSTVAPAQITESGLAPRLPAATAAAYYYIAKPGELTMQVNIWGFVKNSGRYEVASSTDLVQLLSFAGGPIQYAKLSDVRITRAVKTDSGTNKKEFSVDMERLDKLTEQDLELRPGDTIFLDHTGWLTARDVFTVVTTAAIITSAVTQIIWASRR